MKQTFIYKFRSGNVDKPISREQLAAALIEIAKQLRLPEKPDLDQRFRFTTEALSFDLVGIGTNDEGSIRLITNL